MEVSIFPRSDVREVKQHFVEARLHNDAENPEFRQRIAGLIDEVAKTKAQPTYVVMDPWAETEVNRWGGAPLLPGQDEQFIGFLQDMQDQLDVPRGPGARKAGH